MRKTFCSSAGLLTAFLSPLSTSRCSIFTLSSCLNLHGLSYQWPASHCENTAHHHCGIVLYSASYVAVRDRGGSPPSRGNHAVSSRCHESSPGGISRCIRLHCDPFSNQVLSPDWPQWHSLMSRLEVWCQNNPFGLSMASSKKGTAQSLHDWHRKWPGLLLYELHAAAPSSVWAVFFAATSLMCQYDVQLHMAL